MTMPIIACKGCTIVFTTRDSSREYCGLCLKKDRERRGGFTLGPGVAQYADTPDGPLATNVTTEEE